MGIMCIDLTNKALDKIGQVTLTIAASNASITSKGRSDYICDGLADNVEIQAAIDYISPNGGTIRLTEGLFTIADAGGGYCLQIAQSNVHLVIPIGATVKLRNNEIAGVELCNLIRIGDGAAVYSNILIDGGGTIDGNEDNNTSTGDICAGADIYISGPVSNIKVSDLSLSNASRDAIYIVGLSAASRASNITVENCKINNPAEGIVWSKANNVWIVRNSITNTREQDGVESIDNCNGWWIVDNYFAGIHTSNSAIDIFSNANLNTNGVIRGNYILGTASVSGDLVVGLASTGPISNILVQGNILISAYMCFATGAGGVSGILVEGNIIEGPLGKYGIWLDAFASGVSIAGNDIHKCGYSGINVLCGNSDIRNNRIYNNGQNPAAGVGDNVGIKCASVTGTQIIGNDIYDDQGVSHTQYCPINYDGSTNTSIINNSFSGHMTSNYPLANASTTPKIKDNTGFITEKGGAAAAIADGGSWAHGLALAPQIIVASPSISGEMVSVTAVDGVNITVAIKKHDGAAGTAQTIYWEAEMTTFPAF